MMFAGAPNYVTVSRSVSGAVISMAAVRHVSSPSQIPCHGFVVGSSVSFWKSCLVGATALMVRERSARRPQSKKRGLFKKNEKRALHKSGEVLSTGTLPVGDGFELYYEEHGQKDGIPVVFLHGGPGAGSSRRMAQLFDPSKYRIVLFDQRGCGKSVRNASTTAEEQLDENTTWHHVSDLEVLRTHLKIDRWVVAGGSWGTCLALAYASKFQERVLAMALRAVSQSCSSIKVLFMFFHLISVICLSDGSRVPTPCIYF